MAVAKLLQPLCYFATFDMVLRDLISIYSVCYIRNCGKNSGRFEKTIKISVRDSFYYTQINKKVNGEEEIPNLTGAYIDEKRGALKVTDISKEDYPGKLFDDGIYHLYDYQFFFRNLQENVKNRLSAYEEKYADRIDVLYDGDAITFDVELIIENGRTLVPFRAIFETMGCAVCYTEEDGKQIVTARRANDSLLLTIGENKMYFNGKEIALDVPAKIKEGRTLVPLRAISEAFECNVDWDGDTKTIYISSPANAYRIYSEKISETVTDDEGNILIDAVAYYPVIKNYKNSSCFDKINFDFKWDADKFIEEAKAKKDDALFLKKEISVTPCLCKDLILFYRLAFYNHFSNIRQR